MPYKDKNDEVKHKKKYYREHKEERYEYQRGYIKTDKGKIACQKALDKYQRTDKGKKSRDRSIKMHREKYKPIYDNLKINGCAICGSYNRLDFHHTNPEDKKFNISHLLSYDNEDIITELNKCILLCRSCHTKIEYKEKQQDII